jgi:hypothetical protein
LLDVGGRVRASRAVRDAEPGDHVVHLSEAAGAAPGIYLLRLRQSGSSIVRRVCVIR